MTLSEEIQPFVADRNIATEEVGKKFLAKLAEGGYSRDEDPTGHFGVYFAPYNPGTKEVFITHHKKSGLWLFPGGHLDKGELTLQTLTREMYEELGVVYNPPVNPGPFLFTVTSMDTPNYACKTHYDVWYSIATDGTDFKIDPSEFHETRWLSINEARKLFVDEQNLLALAKIEDYF